jgi:uncharacterized membrane protein
MRSMTDAMNPRTARRIYLLTAAGTILWLAAIFLAPWLAAKGASGPARMLYAFFRPVCHQIANRCFMLAGHPLAVCGRCLGIYIGFAAGLLLYPFIRGFRTIRLPRPLTFILSVLPLAVDGVAGVLGLWKSPIGVRFVTGLIWGGVLPFYFVAGFADLARNRRRRRAALALEKSGGPK